MKDNQENKKPMLIWSSAVEYLKFIAATGL